MRILANLTIAGTLDIDTVLNANADTDRFLVQESNGLVRFRTGAEVLADIGAQGAITLTTTGTSGAATLIGNTLNIPNYSSALGSYVPYTGATQNVNLGEWGITGGYAGFDLTPTGTPTTAGTMSWDDGEGTVNLVLKGGNVNLPIGAAEIVRVYNDTASTMTKGQIVYIKGAQGNRVAVGLADNNGDITSSVTFGMVSETIAAGGEGFVTISGKVPKLNTTGLTAGAALWLGATPGTYTQTKPAAPNHAVLIGYVERVDNIVGSIFIKVQNGYELEELHNVQILTTPANNTVLSYESSSDLYKMKSIPTLLGYTPANAATTLTINGTTYDLSANRTWNVGTVTSVGLTAPTGFTVSNSPITSSGNIALAFAAGYSLPTTASQANWDAAYNDKINSAAVTGTTTKTLTLTQQDGGTITASWTDLNTDAVTSVFGRTGAVVATSGDYNTSQVTENTNLYFTENRVRGTVLTGLNVTGGSIAATDSILTAFGKVQNQINGLIGGSIYQGTWNASTNTPTLTSSIGTKGYYYIVSVAGTTNLNGITDWQIGDWAIYDGTSWQKVDNTDSVISVNGFTGAVSLTTNNISENTNLYFTEARVRATLLTGYTVGANAALAATDSVLAAFGKVQGQLNAKEPTINAGTTAQYYRGDKTFQTLNTAAVPELTNLYYTDARARAAISLTTTGSSGAATYNNSTGVLNIPNYGSALSGYLPLTGGTMTGGITFASAPTYTPLRFTGGVADYTVAEQDGAGRVNWYWNKSGTGGSPTFQVSSEDAVRLKFSTTQAAGAEAGIGVYYAAAGTAGGAITWTEVMGAFHNGFRVLPAATFSSTITATQFIRSGGTATQILAANGSVITAGTNITISGGTISATDTGITSLNGLTALSQTFAVGTSGADFGISSTTSTHTFNLPTASATNRGALSSADWSTFNSKEPAIPLGTTLQYWRGDKSWQTLNTAAVPESGNLYYTDARARASLSFQAGSGAYNSTTGVITIPTNTNQLTNGASFITLTSLSASAPLSYNNTTGAFTISQASSTTNGFLSSTDWNIFNNKQNALTNPVTGTGTINYVAKFTATGSAIGNSQIFDNGTNVGIGTTSPTTRLTVVGQSTNTLTISGVTVERAANIVPSSLTGNLSFSFNTTNADSYIHSFFSGGSLVFGTRIAPDNFERARITAAGNFGLGTATPNISGFTRTLTIASSGNNAIELASDANVIQGMFLANANGLSVYGVGAIGMRFFTSTSGAATERMRLDASGNLGLGVTPSAWGSGWKVFQFGIGGSLSFTAGANTTIGNNHYFDGTNDIYIQNANALMYRQTTTGQHIFYTSPQGTAGSAITFTQAMTLDASGRLGLGTTTFNYSNSTRGQFAINGSTDAILELQNGTTSRGYIFANASGLEIASPSTRIISFSTNGTTAATITSGQRLLIGTTTDNGTDRLQVNGSGLFTGALLVDDATNGRVTITNTASNNNIFSTTTGFAAYKTLNIYASGTTPTLSLSSTGAATFSSSVTATQFNASLRYAWGTATNGTTGQIGTDNTNNYFDYIGNLYFRGAAASNTLITFTQAGAATFSSSVTAGGQFVSTQANSTATGGGQIYLNGATGNRIDFNTNGSGDPTFTTRSVGTKIVLYPFVGASTVDCAIGTNVTDMWYSVPSSSAIFKWYAGTTVIGALLGSGTLLVNTVADDTINKLQVAGSGRFTQGIDYNVLKPTTTTTASTATLTPNLSLGDTFTITAQAAALSIANPTGTPVNGQKMLIRIKDNGTARAITWSGSQYRASTDLALPTTTIINKTMYMGFIWNSTDSRWDLIAFLNNI